MSLFLRIMRKDKGRVSGRSWKAYTQDGGSPRAERGPLEDGAVESLASCQSSYFQLSSTEDEGKGDR